MAQALQVWMNGVAVGVWTTTRSGTPAFLYEKEWVVSPASRVLSLSLPMTSTREIRGEVVNNYFDNLLPDSPAIRKRLGNRFKLRSAEAFDLLAAIGRDCVGAVQLLPEGAEPIGWNRIEAQPMSEEDIERHLRATTSSTPFGPNDAEDDYRISIAGAQEKTALLRVGNGWYRPHGATPTTHIIKLPLGLVGNMRADMSQSVENEWLCAEIVREMGLPIARTEMASFGKQRALVVERFDRRWQGIDALEVARPHVALPKSAWIARLPQEDLCQALGLASARKYQSDGGPGIEDSLRLLAHGANAAGDRAGFIQAQFVFWLMAATDGHAKNFSISHRRGGAFGLTPLYDVLSAWPIIGKGPSQVPYQRAKLAMAVRGKSAHYKLGEIWARHWQELARRSGLPGLWEQLQAMAGTVGEVLQRVEGRLPADFPGSIWEKTAAGLQRHAEQLLRESALP